VKQELRAGKNVLHFTNRYRCKDGTYRWLDWLSHPNPEKGITFAIAHDITESKRAEEQIKAALKEKEVLLREVHHRVKNNLMVVTSLIEMQSAQTTQPEALNLFRDLRNRVMAMSLVHEDLYQSKNLAQIEFDAYLERLISNIHRGFAKTRAAITIDAADILLDVHQAIPCGLIVAELVTNAFKYAFPTPPYPSPKGESVESTSPVASMLHSDGGHSRSGLHLTGGGSEIRIEMQKTGDTYTLIVSDNGVGLPSEFDMRTSKTLGMSLVRSWVAHQLKGTIEIDKREGAAFRITFPGS
jgi:two-component sensor histidine kinase